MTQPFDPNRLLRVDATAEIQRLGHAYLQGPHEAPAECVRLGIRAGAQQVIVRLDRAGFEIRATGPIAESAGHWVRALEQLRLSSTSEAERHRCVVALEEADATALLALVAIWPTSSELAVEDGGAVQATLVIRVRSRLALREANAHLHRALEYSPVPVFVNEVQVTPPPLEGQRFTGPLAGHFRFASAESDLTIVVTDHGLTAARLVLSNLPPLRVHLELGQEQRGNAAQLRDRARHFAPEALRQALAWIQAESGAGRPPPDGRRFVCEALLHPDLAVAARKVPLFTVIGRHETHTLSFDALGEMSRGTQELHVLSPGQDPRDFVIDRPVTVLSEHERGIVGRLLGIRISAPPPIHTRRSPRQLARFASRSGAAAVSRLLQRLRPAGRLLPESELTTGQKLLLRALQQVSPGSGISRGGGGIRRQGKRVVLPMNNPQVRRACEWLRKHPGDAYLALMSIWPSPETIGTHRGSWIRRQASA